MRLSEPIEKPGFFWVPEDAENRVPGILHISESGKVILEVSHFRKPRLSALNNQLLQYLQFASENWNLNRITGIIDNDLVTLDNCFFSKRSSTSSGVSTATIHANRAFIGVNYDKEEEVTLSKLTFSVEGLDEWLSVSGFQVEQNWEDMSASIDFNLPEEIALNLPDGIELKFTFIPNVTEAVTEARITQKVYISLVSQELRPIEYFLALVFKLHNFLCFAIDKTVSLDFLTGYSNEIIGELKEGKRYEIPISIYYQIQPYSEFKPNVHRHDMLFCYRNVADQIEGILTKWIETYEISEPAFNLYFASKSGGHKYLDSKFLSLAQGIETLHRRESQEKKRWIKAKPRYANELSLRQRIERMVERFEYLFGDKNKRQSFINKVTDMRNYLTHYDRKLADRAASRRGLWKLYRKLEALFQLHFLRLIGMDLECIKSIVNGNEELRDKLGLKSEDSSEKSV